MYVIIKRQESKAAWRNAPSVIHQEFTEAAGEAARLATNNVGFMFDVFELVKVGSAIGQVEVTWTEIKPERAKKRR